MEHRVLCVGDLQTDCYLIWSDPARAIVLDPGDEAERILRSTAANSAEWYFLMGSIAYKRGWMDDARQNFWTASSMEPNNIEYRQAVNQMNLQAQRGSYQGGDDLANLCTTLCCLNCLCNSCN